MTYFKRLNILFFIYAFNTQAELKEIDDAHLSNLIGQSGITIDSKVPLSVDSIVLDLEGKEGVIVITGNPLDENTNNDRAMFNYQYQGLTLDILNEGVLSIGLPEQFIIDEVNTSIYLAESATIKSSTYTTEPRTYTAFINSNNDAPAHSTFTLELTGANFDSTGNGSIEGQYGNNTAGSTDGASATFTIVDPGGISISVTSDDRNEGCWAFCGGSDDGEIIIVDENGDLIAFSSEAGVDTSLSNVLVEPNNIIEQLGSNFLMSAKMSGTFDLTGSINVFSGVPVSNRP